MKMKLMKMNSKNEMNRTWENLITNMPKEAIDKQIESKVFFSVPSNDPWLVSVNRTLEIESVSLLGSKVTGLTNRLTSRPPVPKLITSRG